MPFLPVLRAASRIVGTFRRRRWGGIGLVTSITGLWACATIVGLDDYRVNETATENDARGSFVEPDVRVPEGTVGNTGSMGSEVNAGSMRLDTDCDPDDNPCKECVTASDCRGDNRACVGGVCGCAPSAKPCGAGCIPNNQCCDVCTGGRDCNLANGNCECPPAQQFINNQCRLNVGQACSPNGIPCASGACVDGVCCESECTGLCRECEAGTGRCVMPADDIDCPTVTCPPDSACRTGAASNANINVNSCQRLGQCKTVDSCRFTNAPARTVCDGEEALSCAQGATCRVANLCNGAGVCVPPTVDCPGENDLAVSLDSCCRLAFPREQEEPGDTVEGPTNECEAGFFREIKAWCDGEGDCPAGDVCCVLDGGDFNSIACASACPSEPGVVCGSPGGGPSTCPAGTSCQPFSRIPGWSTCVP